MYYVTMTDKFMSGWGDARDKTNKLVIECATYSDAALIAKNARLRREMRRVNIRSTRPYYSPASTVTSWKSFDELSGPWKE
jgi:hypothetical protein